MALPIRTTRIMLLVLFCLLPGTLVTIWFLGTGILINIFITIITAIGTEAAVLRLRRQNLQTSLDGSAATTGLLLALALPPDLPIELVIFASTFAILFGKQLYGGLGHNLFNPAMVGYAALIVTYPLAMSSWPTLIDGSSGATNLDTFKFRGSQTVAEVWQANNGFGTFGGLASEWINLAFFVGGLGLIALRAARWEAPLAMLLTIFILAILFYDSGSSQSLGSPLLHLFSGGTMLAAFFVITDPVTAPDSRVGLYLFGFGVGVLTFMIRNFGAYPDGIAFAVLLMNAVTPMLDHIRFHSRC